MARHKQIVTEEQGDPEMNISSMIDCCFLLLIYFLVATSLVSEKKLDMSIPGNQAEGGKPATFTTREYTRCTRCGRARGVSKKFKLCRICFRELALSGQIPGITKASW